MRRFWVRLLVLIGVATFGATSPHAAPWRFEAEGVAATVGQPDAATLVVGLRLAERGSFESAALALPDGSVLEPESPLAPYPVGDSACRRKFHQIKTSWTLEEEEVNALMDVGKALPGRDPAFEDLLRITGAKRPAFPSLQQTCEKFLLSGKSRTSGL